MEEHNVANLLVTDGKQIQKLWIPTKAEAKDFLDGLNVYLDKLSDRMNLKYRPKEDINKDGEIYKRIVKLRDEVEERWL